MQELLFASGIPAIDRARTYRSEVTDVKPFARLLGDLKCAEPERSERSWFFTNQERNTTNVNTSSIRQTARSRFRQTGERDHHPSVHIPEGLETRAEAVPTRLDGNLAG